jgi:hypothetical protein
MDGTQKSCLIHCCLIHHCLSLSTLQALNVYGGLFSLRCCRTDAGTGKACHRTSQAFHRMNRNRHSMTYAEWGRCSGTSAPSLGMILMLYRKRLSAGVSRKAEYPAVLLFTSSVYQFCLPVTALQVHVYQLFITFGFQTPDRKKATRHNP